MELPFGVRLLELGMNRDLRGNLSEFFRAEWSCGVEPVQWNVARSAPGSLRGVHVHPLHDDLVVLAAGRLAMGLYDLRRGSPTFGRSALAELDAERMQALVIPRGVGHGSVHLEPTVVLVGVSAYWGEPIDEIGCRWDDPALGIDWPVEPTLVTERDATAPSLGGLLELSSPGSRSSETRRQQPLAQAPRDRGAQQLDVAPGVVALRDGRVPPATAASRSARAAPSSSRAARAAPRPRPGRRPRRRARRAPAELATQPRPLDLPPPATRARVRRCTERPRRICSRVGPARPRRPRARPRPRARRRGRRCSGRPGPSLRSGCTVGRVPLASRTPSSRANFCHMWRSVQIPSGRRLPADRKAPVRGERVPRGRERDPVVPAEQAVEEARQREVADERHEPAVAVDEHGRRVGEVGVREQRRHRLDVVGEPEVVVGEVEHELAPRPLQQPARATARRVRGLFGWCSTRHPRVELLERVDVRPRVVRERRRPGPRPRRPRPSGRARSRRRAGRWRRGRTSGRGRSRAGSRRTDASGRPASSRRRAIATRPRARRPRPSAGAARRPGGRGTRAAPGAGAARTRSAARRRRG